MSTRNKRIRFMTNNFAELISASISVSSALSAFPISNAINKFRSRVFKFSGRFTISSTTNKLYINDGAPKTISLTAGEYTTPALLATHIQTQLNATSSGWTVTYDSVGETFRFIIANTGSVTLRLSTTTDAVWTTIGYTTSLDIVGTSFTADRQRNHYPNETITMDMGFNATMTFLGLIGPLNEVFSINEGATVKLLGSNLNQWTTPPLSITLDVTDKGILRHLDDQTDTAYRFWRIELDDTASPNPAGPEGVSIGNLYLGDYITLSNRNVGIGFDKGDVDKSDVEESTSGVLHFDRKTKYQTISGASIGLLDKADKDTLSAMYEKLGNTTPFYVSLDPTLAVTDELTELTLYVVFPVEPRLIHIIAETYSMSLSFRELV